MPRNDLPYHLRGSGKPNVLEGAFAFESFLISSIFLLSAIMNQKRVIIDNIPLRYIESGNAEAEKTIVFLHGWMGSAASFAPVMEKMGNESFRLISIDFPGFGETQKPNTVWGVHEYAVFVKNFIERLTLKNVTLVGHSFGGRVSIALCATHPNVVEKCVLIGSAGIPPQIPFIHKIGPTIARPFWKLPGMNRLRKKLRKKFGSTDYNNAGEMTEILKKTIRQDLCPLFTHVTLPVLLIW